MSSTVINFGDSNTTGNTTLQQNLVVQGAFSNFAGNLYSQNIGNVASPITSIYGTKANITTINTASITSPTATIGINTSSTGASLQVGGNIYASNSISSTNAFFSAMNISLLNTASMFFSGSSLGINATPTGNTLEVGGNLFVSNSISTQNITAYNFLNATTINTSSLFSRIGNFGNIVVSNSITSTNLVSTNANIGTLNVSSLFMAKSIISVSDVFKSAPYFLASPSNASTIQSWIQATCNIVYNTYSFWAQTASPSFSNITSGPLGLADYSGGVLLPDGRVLFVPSSSSSVGFFTPGTGLFSTIVPSGQTLASSTLKYQGGVVIPNGNVCFVPYASGGIGVFNPLSGIYSNAVSVGGPLPAGQGYFTGGILTPDGKITFVPGVSGNIGSFNYTNFTYSNITPTGTSTSTLAFQGGVLLPNGNVICVPSTNGNVGMYNPYTTVYTNLISIGGPSSAFNGGVLAPNGNVIFIPSSSANVGVLNPSDPSFSNIPNLNLGGTTVSKFLGGILSPTGNVFMMPGVNSSNIGMFDPVMLTYSNVSATSGGFGGATQIPDGRIILVPTASQNVCVLNTIAPVGPEFCLAPYFNKY